MTEENYIYNMAEDDDLDEMDEEETDGDDDDLVSDDDEDGEEAPESWEKLKEKELGSGDEEEQ